MPTVRSSPSLLAVVLAACSLDERHTIGPASQSGATEAAPDLPRLQVIVPSQIDGHVGREVMFEVSVPNREALASVLVVDASSPNGALSFEQGAIGMRATSTVVRGHIDPYVSEVDVPVNITLSSIRGVESTARAAVRVIFPPGSLDPAFGARGITFVNQPFDDFQMVTGLVVAPTGKVLVAGQTAMNGVVVRLDDQGRVDHAFGQRGVATIESNALAGTAATALALSPAGVLVGIVDAGVDGDAHAYVTRLTDAGAVDTTFGVGGRVLIGHPNESAVSELAVRSDGSILVVSTDRSSFTSRMTVEALSANGLSVPDFAPFTIDGSPTAVTVLPSGDLSMTAISAGQPLNVISLKSDGTLERFVPIGMATSPGCGILRDGGTFRIATVDGALVTLDGTSPEARFSRETRLATTTEVAFDAAKRAVAIGLTQGMARIERRNADGTVDPTFAPRPAPIAAWQAIALAPDGKIVVAGHDEVGASLVVARYWP